MITPKPFRWAEKIYRSVFLEKGGVFSAQDLNRQLDALYEGFTAVSDKYAPVKSNYIVSANITAGLTPQEIQIDVTITKRNPANGAYLFYKGVRFDVPEYSRPGGAPLLKTRITPVYSTLAVCLVAKRVTVDFSADQVMSGITDQSQNISLPGAENKVFRNERIVFIDENNINAYTVNGVNVYTPAANEEIIAVLAVVCPKETTNQTTGAPAVNYVLRECAFELADLAAIVGFQRTPSGILQGANKRLFLDNKSLFDLHQYTLDYIDREVSALRYLTGATSQTITSLQNQVSALNTNLATLSGQVSGISTSLQQLGQTVSALSTTVSNHGTRISVLEQTGLGAIPVGGIIDFSGTITGNFDQTGKGVAGTPFQRFALCNGNNGTPDLRGRFRVGYDDLVPPYNSVGAKVGSMQAQLTAGNLPAHDHVLTKPVKNVINFVGSGGNKTIANGGDWDDTGEVKVGTNNGGGGAFGNPFSILPASVVLAPIMRIS